MTEQNTAHFKTRLEEERQKLEEALSRVGRRNPAHPQDWEPVFTSVNEQSSSQDEVADKFEEMEQSLALQSAYEHRMEAIQSALAKIEAGTYGYCPACKKDIPVERLEADPAASCMCGG